MRNFDYLIIGGGIAGVTAAETIREHDQNGTIGIMCDEGHLFYSRVLLPAYLKNRIHREQLFLRRGEDFAEKKIDLRLETKLIGIDVKRNEVWLASNETVSYKKLLLSSGGRVKKWGDNEEYIYRLQTLEDADRLLAATRRIKRPLVIGSSFISLEFLEIFVTHKILPTVLLRDSYFLANILDNQGGALLQENFESQGITLQFSDEVSEINPHTKDFDVGINLLATSQDGGTKEEGINLRVVTKGLHEIQCDSIAVGVGIDRNLQFLIGSGVELGDNGIKVNEFLETNAEGIFAAGDVAEFYDLISGKHRALGNWTNAFLQGKIAGLNMVGTRSPFKNVPAYSITNFGFQITALGDCDRDVESVVRIDRKNRRYERFFIRDGIIIGAALINRFQDKPHLAALIEKRVNIEEQRERLIDWEFDIKTISLV